MRNEINELKTLLDVWTAADAADAAKHGFALKAATSGHGFVIVAEGPTFHHDHAAWLWVAEARGEYTTCEKALAMVRSGGGSSWAYMAGFLLNSRGAKAVAVEQAKYAAARRNGEAE